jgi:cytochrome c-type biogenesis protein CcmH/NrfG
MSATLIPAAPLLERRDDPAVPAFPWRDPHTVPRTDLAAYIGELERACAESPASPVLWTCLGMAYAVNYDVMKSMDALERAMEVDPTHFWARLKSGELQYRLRALDCAEDETVKALDLAENAIQLSMARKQLREIRALNPPVRRRAAASKVGQALFLSGLMVFAYLAVAWG